MGYNILGINTSHNGSVCVLVNGEIDFFLEEERLSKLKYDDLPIELIKFISKKYKIDEIVMGGLGQSLVLKRYDLYTALLSELFPNIPILDLVNNHHLCHVASSFFTSKFKNSLGITIDGSGTYIESPEGTKCETESAYILNYTKPPDCIYKSYRLKKKDENFNLTLTYEMISFLLGFKFHEAGKTMGLSSYGKPNSKIPPIYINDKSNPLLLKTSHDEYGALELTKEYKHLLNSEELKQDLAFAAQNESQQLVGDIIEKNLKKTGLKQVCCSGGWFFNCVGNYYLKKRFPNIDFWFVPLAGDSGVSIGAAKLAWYQKTLDKTIRPQKTLYLGPQYSKQQLLEGIQKYLD